jgi:hypothetical protein
MPNDEASGPPALPVEFIFTFDDVKHAIMGEKRLLDEGITVMVMPKPHQLGSRCGICLRVLPADRERAGIALTAGDGSATYSGLYAVYLPPARTAGGGGVTNEAVASLLCEKEKVFTPWNH